MAKSKKSKILAMALCASVMTGIYASPVMAGTITGIPSLSTGDDEIIINGVTLKNHGIVEASQGNFANAVTIKNGWLNIGEGKFYVNATDGNTEIEGTLKVTGNTTLGVLNAGATTLDSLTVTGPASLNGGLNVSGAAKFNGMLTADAGLTVTSNGIEVEDGGLLVEQGLAELNGGLSVTGGAKADSLEVTGDTTLNGLTAGATDVDSLTVNTDKFVVDAVGNTTVGGTLTAGSGNFTVDTDGNTTIIGADKQLTVEGTAQIGTMTATTAQVGGALTVVGETTLAGLTAKGAADLQDGLTVSKGATVNGGLTVDTDRFVVDGVTGNTTVGGTLNVTGDTTLAGLTANGAANLKGGLKVTGGTETDELKVTGVATVDSLKVTNNADLDGNLTVKGELSAANNKFGVDVDGNIRTTGGANIGGDTTIGGALTVTNNANITGNATVGGGLNVTGNATVGGGLGVTGGANVTGGFTVTGGSTLSDGLTVNGLTTLNNGLLVNGDAEIDGKLKVGSVADVEQSIVDLEAYTEDLKDADLPGKVEGIDRDPVDGSVPNGEGVTTIEGMAKFDSEGMTIGNTVVTDGEITTNTINAGGTIINNAGMTVGDTVVADSKITVGAEGDQTVIEGGAITAKSLLLGTKDVGATIAGIKRETVTDEFGTVNTTTIEGALKVSDNGLISNADGSFTVDSYGGLAAGGGTFAADMTGIKMNAPVQMFLQGDSNYKGISVIDLGTTISDIDDRLDVLEDKTQNIKPGTGAGTGTGEGGTAVGEDNNLIDVPPTEDGHTGINGDVTVGGEINAGAGNIGGVGMEEGTITAGDGNFTGDVDITGDINAGTGNIGGVGMEEGTITTGDTAIDGSGITTGNGNFTGDVDITGDINAGTGNIGGIDMAGGTINTGNTTIDGDGMTVGKGTDITDIKDGNITVKGDEGKVEIGKGDVAIFDENGEKVTSIQHNYDEINRVEEKFDGEVNRLDNRITKVEDRIDKVGAMSAAIANLRTMGYDPAAPTEIAVGVGQYRSETGVALGMFHYPNKDFMLSLSVSTSGDEVMGGIGATWKFGRKSPEKVLAAEKEKAAKAKLAKAEAMKKAAKEAKIKAQQERHAKLAAERAAQAEAAK